MFALLHLDAARGPSSYIEQQKKGGLEAARAAQAPSLAAVSDMQRLSALSDAPLRRNLWNGDTGGHQSIIESPCMTIEARPLTRGKHIAYLAVHTQQTLDFLLGYIPRRKQNTREDDRRKGLLGHRCVATISSTNLPPSMDMLWQRSRLKPESTQY
ncbi:hypothetical protein TgHK011_002822 [Trichoderma gracile]|nr:hypothetical protein TgHK011_002822 [Trichoderma gracile]